MADRIVKVSLRAEINNYLSGMEQARKKTREVGSESEKTAAKLQQQKEAFNLVGGTLLAAGTLAAAAVGVAVKKWMDFDQAMSAVAAATHETTENMAALRDAALSAGARTVFSATEAANAVEELGKAGLSTTDILQGGLDGALDLAAAGGLGVADAAGIAAVALKTFGLRGTDMAHVADLLAAGAGKAMGDVSDLSMALSQGGQVAAATGLSIEETTAALAAFASQGLIGSDAGTAFKSMLQRLTPQSTEAKNKMQELGISAYDAAGNFVGLDKFAGTLRAGLKDLTTEQRQSALATIFGSDAVRAATVLYSEGESGIRDWEDAVNDAGYATETAAKRLDNLAGDWEQFSGAVETASIKAGQAADGPLRFLTQSATEMVQAFADAPDGVQQGVLAIGAVTAAVMLGYGAYLVAIPKVAEYRAALETLGTTAQRTGRILGLAFKGVTLAAGVVAAVFVVNDLLKKLQATDAELENVASTSQNAGKILETAFKGTTTANNFKNAAESAKVFRTQLDNLGEIDDNWWATFAHGTDGTFDLNNALGKLGTTLGTMSKSNLPAAQEAFKLLADRTDGSDKQLHTLLDRMGPFKDALTEQATAAGLAADDQTLLKIALGETSPKVDDNTEALAGLKGAAADTKGAVGELADAIRGFGSAQLDTRDAARTFEDALDSLDESVKNNGNSLDITTDAGRQNEQALDDIAKAALGSAAAIAEQTGSEDDARAAVEQGREALIKKLEQFGITGQAAQAYADKLGLIPKNIDTAIYLQKDAAQRDLDNWIAYNSTRRIGVHVDGIQGYSGAGGITKADGGYIRGPGTGRSDSIKAWLSDGEFVTRASQVAKPENRAALEYMNAGGTVRGYAGGGYVQPVYATAGPARSAPAGAVTIAPVIHAAPGMDEGALARKVVRLVEEKLK